MPQKLKHANTFRNILLIGCLLIFVLIQFHCTNREPAVSQQYASLDTSNSYVGMNTCKNCHISIYETFIETGMGKSFEVASHTKSAAKFGDTHKIYDKHLDFWYKPYWENDSMKIMEYRLAGKDTVHKRIETVSYIIGSGQHTNSHMMNTNGYVNQMPMTFYTQKGHWDLPPGFENGGNTRFGRLIGLECMTCHNSYPVFTKGSENKYEFIDQGIGCERCHGPGGQHVKDKTEGKIVDVVTGIDYSIVNPAKLPINLQLDVCQRCHIQGNAILNEGKSFFDFRPGMSLSSVMNVFMPLYKGHEEEHIMASHVERMKMSKCFTASVAKAEKSPGDKLRPYKNALTCVTCHNPHVSVKQTGSAHFNDACKNCHTTGKEKLCTENPEVLHLQQNNCVSCHMPSSGATDIPHVSVHDHLIRIPIKEETVEKIKEFIGINCINNQLPTDEVRGRAFIAYFEKFNFGIEVLDSARHYFPDNTPENIRKNFKNLVQIAFLEKNYNKVIEYTNVLGNAIGALASVSYDNFDAWTSYRIGESYFETGNLKEAEIYLANANKLAPYHPDFSNKYATVLSLNNKSALARQLLEKSLNAYPKNAPAASNLGYLVLVTSGDTSTARKYYDQALALDPDYEQAIINQAGLLSFRGKHKEAQQLLITYLKRKPGSVKANAALQQIKNIRT